MGDGTVGNVLSSSVNQPQETGSHMEPNTNWDIPVTEGASFDVTESGALQRESGRPTDWSPYAAAASDVFSPGHVAGTAGGNHPHRHANNQGIFHRRASGSETQDYKSSLLHSEYGNGYTKGNPEYTGWDVGTAGNSDSSTPEGFLSSIGGLFNSQSTEKYKHNLLSNQIIYGINPSQISANFSTSETHTGFSLWINESNYNNSTSGNSTLSTLEDHTAIGLLGDISLGFVLGLLCMTTFVGNAMVLHAVRTEKRLQSVSNMFIVSLAIADLVVGLIVMPISAIYIFTKDWNFGIVVCQLWIGVDYIASTASILNLFILSLDRYWSVTSPLKYLRKRTKKRALIMIFLVWFASTLWLIPIIGWHHFEHDGVRTVPDNVCDTEYAQNTILKIITGILNYYLPLAIMYALYTKVFIEIRKRSKFELGQRTCGGGVTANGGGQPVHSSITDESDQRNCYEPETVQENFSQFHHTEVDERKKFLNPGMSRLTSECDTETSEDEHTRLHKGKYTNLRLVKGTQDSAQDSDNAADMPNSDIEIRVEYFYDESVVDSSTEKVHRFYDEHARQKHRSRNAFVDTAETSLTIPNRANVRQVTSKPNVRKPLIVPKQGKKHVYFAKYRSKKSKETRSGGRKLLSGKGRSGRSSQSGHGRGPPLISLKNKLPLDSSDAASNVENDSDSKVQETNLTKKARRFREKIVKSNVKKKSPSLAREIKAAKQLGVIMGAFTICFCPYFILFMVVAFCEHCVPIDLMTAMTWVGYLNSTLNPILYPLCNLHFRRKFKRMLRIGKESENNGQIMYSRYYVHRHSGQTDVASKYDY